MKKTYAKPTLVRRGGMSNVTAKAGSPLIGMVGG
jgi:hypothetical protein